MKKTIQSLTFSLLIAALSLFSASCSKSVSTPAPANTAVIKLNGAQPSVDSVTATVHTNNSVINEIYITAHLDHNPAAVCEIQLYFSPADPLYATGAVIDFASTHYAEIFYRNTSSYYDDIMHPYHSGTITITKNDVAARRIEGTLTNCVATATVNGSSTSITIDGSFAVTYPVQ
jgi:hypothetical protein